MYCKERACVVQKLGTPGSAFTWAGQTVLCSLPINAYFVPSDNPELWQKCPAPTDMTALRLWRRTGALGLTTVKCCFFLGLWSYKFFFPKLQGPLHSPSAVGSSNQQDTMNLKSHVKTTQIVRLMGAHKKDLGKHGICCDCLYLDNNVSQIL